VELYNSKRDGQRQCQLLIRKKQCGQMAAYRYAGRVYCAAHMEIAQKIRKVNYEVVVWTGRHWTNDETGQPNVFETEAEAWNKIATLRTTGPDWAEAEFHVRPIEAAAPKEEEKDK
jgi:hypothetical protein